MDNAVFSWGEEAREEEEGASGQKSANENEKEDDDEKEALVLAEKNSDKGGEGGGVVEGSTFELEGLSCEFVAGKVYAVVGPVGSGKSTLVASILGVCVQSVCVISCMSPCVLYCRERDVSCEEF